MRSRYFGMPLVAVGAAAVAIGSACGHGGRQVTLNARVLAPEGVDDPYGTYGVQQVTVTVWQNGADVGHQSFAAGESWTLPKTDADLSSPVVIEVVGMDGAGKVVAAGRTHPVVPDTAGSRSFGIFFSPPAAASLPHQSIPQHATKAMPVVLDDGRLLVIGGETGGGTGLDTIQLYDPDEGSWRALVSLPSARESVDACNLGNGQVLIAGGEDTAGNTLTDVEILTVPAADATSGTAGTIASTTPLPFGWAGMQCARLPSGNVLFAGGSTAGPDPLPQVFDRSSSTPAWIPAAGGTAMSGAAVAKLPDGRAVIVGGTSAGVPSRRVDVAAETAGVLSISGADALIVPRAGVAAVAVPFPAPAGPEKVLVSGGSADVAATRQTAAIELLDVSGPLPVSSFAPDRDAIHREFRGIARLWDDQVLLAGGRFSGNPRSNAEIWDPRGGAGSIADASDLPTNESGRRTTISLQDGSAAITGSDIDGEVWIFQAPVESLTPATHVPLSITWSGGYNGAVAATSGAVSWRARFYDAESLVDERTFSSIAQQPLTIPSFEVPGSSVRVTLEALDAAGATVAWGSTVAAVDSTTQQAGALSIYVGRVGAFNLARSPLLRNHADPVFAAPLENGKVIVAGGTGTPTGLDSFDPVADLTSSWGITLTPARNQVHAVMYLNSNLLLVGGNNPNAGVPVANTSSYSLKTGTFTTLSAAPATLLLHTTTVLQDGKNVLAYGNTLAGSPAASIFRFTGSAWVTPIVAAPDKRSNHQSTLLTNGSVLITAGLTSNGAVTFTPTTLRYTFTGGVDAITALGTASDVKTLRRDHVAFAIPGGGAILCGGVSSVANNLRLDSCEQWNDIAATWTTLATKLSVQRDDICPMPISPTQMLLIGGGTGAGPSSNAVDLVDFTDTQNVTVTPAPPLAVARKDAVAAKLADGRIVVAAGRDNNVTTTTIEIWTPPTWVNPFGY
jgi:hypothetical protein